MKKITRNIFKYLGYSAFSLVTFLLFFYITFPMEAVQHRLDDEISKATDGKVTLKAKELKLAGISGLRLKDINIFIEGENGATPSRVKLDEFQVKIHLLSTIKKVISKETNGMLGPIGGVDISFKQGQGSGLINLKEEEKNTSVNANIESLAIERLLPAFVSLPIPIRSQFSGRLDGQLKKQWYSNGSGKLTVTLRNTSIGEGSISTPMGPFDLPIIDMGTISTDLVLDKGALKIENWKQTGNDLASSNISGRITLQKKMESSALDIKIAFKPSDAFLEKNGKFNSMLQLAGFKKDAQEHYTFSVGGRWGSPKIKGSAIFGK